MKKILYLTIMILSAAGGCTGCGNGFSDDERKVIGNSGDGIMRLVTVDGEADSVFLRMKAKELTAKHISSASFGVLKERMLATVNDPSNSGVGIAAPQVGLSYRLIAVQRYDKVGEPFEFYVNPRITAYSSDVEYGSEGCLSVPGKTGNVCRSVSIFIEYADEATLEKRSERVEGFTAVIFQHEIDHLDGILYIDRITPSVSADVEE